FYDTSDDHEALIVRPRNLQDNATPSGNSMMAKQLLRLYAYTGEARYEKAAVNALKLLSEALKQYPQAFGEALNAVDSLVHGISEIAIVGAPDDSATDALLQALNASYRPNMILALTPSDQDDSATIPLLRQR